jgi:hypothetical protein
MGGLFGGGYGRSAVGCYDYLYLAIYFYGAQGKVIWGREHEGRERERVMDEVHAPPDT